MNSEQRSLYPTNISTTILRLHSVWFSYMAMSTRYIVIISTGKTDLLFLVQKPVFFV